MNAGDFKREWSALMDDPVPSVDGHWQRLRGVELIKATGAVGPRASSRLMMR
jgi:hypothetical protein